MTPHPHPIIHFACYYLLVKDLPFEVPLAIAYEPQKLIILPESEALLLFFCNINMNYNRKLFRKLI